MLRFSLELPTTRVDQPEELVSAEAVAELTRAAAAAGFSAVNVTDHPAPDAKWLDHGGHHALDPFVALAFAAAADPHIRLHTNIYVAAYRNPFLGAKQIHSLEVLAGGRLILGVAAGYLKPEFAALGVDFERRGALLDEALDVLDAVAAGDDVAWDSPQASARGVRLRPVLPGGRPPVWVGGNSRAAVRRAARYEGWSPFHTMGFARTTRTATMESVEDLAAGVAEVRAARAELGRTGPFDVCWSAASHDPGDRSADERCARLAAVADAGATWTVVSVPGDGRAEVLEGIEAFGREVIAELGS